MNSLLARYDKVMYLKLYVSNNDESLKDRYMNAAAAHNAKVLDPNNSFLDAGFDLFVPYNSDAINNNNHNTYIYPIKISHEVKCCAQMFTDSNKVYNTGFYMDPRSSISKTSYRLANSRGIIDSGYRGNLIGMFDKVGNPTPIEKYDRLLQICAPGLVPIFVEIVNSIEELGEETQRGTGGIGSSGR